MIHELNSAQKEFFESHAKIWLNTRLSCNEMERKTIRVIIETFYEKIGKSVPEIIFLDSPFCWSWERNLQNYLPIFADCLIFNKSLWENFWEGLIPKLDKKVSQKLGEEIKFELLRNLNEKLKIDFWLILIKKISRKFSWAFIDTLFRKNLYLTVKEKIMSKGLGFHIIDPLMERVKKLFEESLLNFYWIAYYEFAEKYLECEYDKKDSTLLNIFSEIAHQCFLCWPFKNICIVCDRPFKIYQQDGHLIFRDGYFL